MLCELEGWPTACFVTLTYDDDHLPGDASLFPYDATCFLKRVRRSIEPRKLRYYLCGEYGKSELYYSRRLRQMVRGTERPHYHAVLFGVDPAESVVSDSWHLGWCKVGTCTEHSIRYVADYVTYKVFGAAAEGVYDRRKAPYAVMSQGLGRDWCDARAEELRASLAMQHRGHEVALPRYFARRLGVTWLDSVERRSEHTAEVRAVHLQRDPNQVGHWYDWETVRQSNAQSGIDARAKQRLKERKL